jgi:polysaccharide pyruvyl transferase WcaK-like protein
MTNRPLMITQSRRALLSSASKVGIIAAISRLGIAADKNPQRLLLRSSWQTVNIGDIAHTPGVLALLERYLPEVEVRLWPSKVDNGVEEMLTQRFPRLIIVKGPEALKKAFDECDFLLHGSGPSLVAEKDVIKWSRETGKPYGVYGITLSSTGNPVSNTIEVLSGARFAFFRDSVSLAFAKTKGCTCPIMEFGPDGAFATDLRDEVKATAFLEKNGLQEGKFLCCIPRLRNTPYWVIPSKKAAFDEKKHARNEAMKEHDHAALREAIVEVVRQTDMKVLICPEDQTQMAVGKELLYDRLPEDVKSEVVWRPDYWLTGEALSTYDRSAGLFGNEMHSPIMCIGNGVPAIVCRWSEQTSKGLMWRDIGLGDWLFDLDKESEIPGIVPSVLAMAKDPAAAKIRAAEGLKKVHQRQQETMAILGREMARK